MPAAPSTHQPCWPNTAPGARPATIVARATNRAALRLDADPIALRDATGCGIRRRNFHAPDRERGVAATQCCDAGCGRRQPSWRCRGAADSGHRRPRHLPPSRPEWVDSPTAAAAPNRARSCASASESRAGCHRYRWHAPRGRRSRRPRHQPEPRAAGQRSVLPCRERHRAPCPRRHRTSDRTSRACSPAPQRCRCRTSPRRPARSPPDATARGAILRG